MDSSFFFWDTLYKVSNVCNQFSRITSFRAIKFKKSILIQKKNFFVHAHNSQLIQRKHLSKENC
jgi:hypothetical protein